MPRAGKWREEIGWDTIYSWIEEEGGLRHENLKKGLYKGISYSQIRERCMQLSSDGSAPSNGTLAPKLKEAVREKMKARHKIYRNTWRGKWARNLDRFRNAETYIKEEYKPSQNGWYYTWGRYTIYDFNQRPKKGYKLMTFEETIKYLEKTQNLDVEASTIEDYWTGEVINLDTDPHDFDHLLPRAKGGKGELDNLVITSRKNNLMHSDMTKE